MIAHIIFSISRSPRPASRVFVFSNAFAMLTAFWWWGIIWWMKVTMGSEFANIDFMLRFMWQSSAYMHSPKSNCSGPVASVQINIIGALPESRVVADADRVGLIVLRYCQVPSAGPACPPDLKGRRSRRP